MKQISFNVLQKTDTGAEILWNVNKQLFLQEVVHSIK